MACRLVVLMTITHKNVSPVRAMLSIKIKDKTLIKYFLTAISDSSFASWKSWPFSIWNYLQIANINILYVNAATIQF